MLGTLCTLCRSQDVNNSTQCALDAAHNVHSEQEKKIHIKQICCVVYILSENS